MIIQGINVANLMTFMLNNVACTMEYDNWSDKYKHKDIKESYNSIQRVVEDIDFSKLTNEEKEFLGFRKFSEDDEDYLIPLWLLRALPDGTELQSIMGQIKVVGKDYIDNDVRFGMTAYKLI